MAAVQAYIDRAEERTEARRRVQLQVSPLPERKRIPEEIRSSVDGIYKEIEDRALRPVIEAPTLDAAEERAFKGFEIFMDLWPAVVGALLSWLRDHPDQLSRLTGAARGLWLSEEAIRRLGEDACEWFSAAQSARQALAGVPLAGLDLDAIGKRALLADFAFMLGVLLMQTPDARPPSGLPIFLAKLAHGSATDAFAMATTRLYADQAP